MQHDDLEQKLRNAVLVHLTDDELDLYVDNESAEIGMHLTKAHLNICHLCQTRLSFFKEENAAIQNSTITIEEVELIDRFIARKSPRRGFINDGSNSVERMAGYLKEMVASWKKTFALEPFRDSKPGQKIWSWESKDKVLKANVIKSKKGLLIINITSADMALEGIHIDFQWDPVKKHLSFERQSGSMLSATIEIPFEERPRKLNNLSIKVAIETGSQDVQLPLDEEC